MKTCFRLNSNGSVFFFQISEVTVKWLALSLCIREVQASHLVPYFNNIEAFRCFPQSLWEMSG
jgi:hypothetical protein